VHLLAGERATEEAWLDERFPVGATAFLQVNRGAGERLHRAVLGAVGASGTLRVVDAYAGVGLLGRALARGGATVTAIEADAEAVEAARHEAPPSLRVVQGRVEDRLSEALPADVVVLNPPRAGIHERVAARLLDPGVGRIVYVSCDPATLARDLGRLSPRWTLRELRCFDLFPQTAHVETLATLEQGSPSP
jgi:23S rRNA (uracil1939-C5)-methyltransferase